MKARIIQDAEEKLSELFESYDLNIEKCHVFESALFALAQIAIVPEGSWFSFHDKEQYCIFSFNISKKITEQFIASLNQLSAQLEATDITEIIAKGDNNNYPWVFISADLDLTHIIRIRSEALFKDILPRIDDYLKNHPKWVSHYKRIGGSFSRTKYDWNLWVYENQKTFLEYGMDTFECDCYEYILAYIIQNAKQRADHASGLLVEILPDVIIQLIFAYLNNISYKGYEEINDLIPKSPSEFFGYDSHSVTFTLPLSLKQGTLMTMYFNNIIDGTAHVVEVKDTKTIEQINLRVDIQTLCHPYLISEIKDTLDRLPQNIIDRFRKESKTISFTTAECLTKLQDAKKMIHEGKMITHIPSKIDELTQYIQESHLEEKEHRSKCNSLIVEMHSLKEKLNKQQLEKQKIKYYLTCWIPFFTPKSIKRRKQIQKELGEALGDIFKITNKRYFLKQ